MTEEEIKKIAREVASQIEPKKGFGGESYWIRLSTEIIEILVNDYCIVPKSKLREVMKYPQRHTDPIRGTMHFQVIGIKKAMIEIFGKSLFEEKGGDE